MTLWHVWSAGTVFMCMIRELVALVLTVRPSEGNPLRIVVSEESGRTISPTLTQLGS
jgi:hypothetical protein